MTSRSGVPTYLASLIPAIWGLGLVLGLLVAVFDSEWLTVVWIVVALFICAAAFLVVLRGRGSSARARWLWAVGSIPASFLGPLAFPLFLVPRVRGDLATVRITRTKMTAETAEPRKAPELSTLVLLEVGALGAFPVAFVLLLIGEIFVVAVQERPFWYIAKDEWELITLIATAVSLGALVSASIAWLLLTAKRGFLSLARAGVALALIVAGFILVAVASKLTYPLGGESPVSVAAPSVSGVPRVGGRLTADRGDWDPRLGLDFDYLWERCEQDEVCREIDAAEDAPHYRLREADVGKRVRVKVVATADWFGTLAHSEMTPVVR